MLHCLLSGTNNGEITDAVNTDTVEVSKEFYDQPKDTVVPDTVRSSKDSLK